MSHESVSSYRRDIDGLRAVSVLIVVAFHAFPEWCPGGFIGVDVFFVISGFLITRIIPDDFDSQRFSILRFYHRRIRRIFPALLAVLIVDCGPRCWMASPWAGGISATRLAHLFVRPVFSEYYSLGSLVRGHSCSINRAKHRANSFPP